MIICALWLADKAQVTTTPQDVGTSETVEVATPLLPKLLAKPIIFLLLVTSFPVGLAPFVAIGSYRGMVHEEHVSVKWRNEYRIEDAWRMTLIGLAVFAVCALIHAGMSWVAWRHWNCDVAGYRGAFWFTLFQIALVMGVAVGIWLLCVAPE